MTRFVVIGVIAPLPQPAALDYADDVRCQEIAFSRSAENRDLALTRGPYRLTTVDAEDNTIVRWGTFNSVWRRNGDRDWQVVFDAGSPADTPPDADTMAILDREDDC